MFWLCRNTFSESYFALTSQPVVARAEIRSNPIHVVPCREVDVAALLGVGREAFVIVSHPSGVGLVLCRIGPHASDDHRVLRVPVTERRGVGWYIVDRAIDRVDVHR